jgi:hypothetical protein
VKVILQYNVEGSLQSRNKPRLGENIISCVLKRVKAMRSKYRSGKVFNDIDRSIQRSIECKYRSIIEDLQNSLVDASE